MVTANISAAVLSELATDLLAGLSENGVLIASGLLAERREEVARAFAKASGVIIEERASEDWAGAQGRAAMSSPRFYVPRDAIEGKTVVLPDGAARQTRVVLRLRPGDSVIVFDGGDSEWPVTLSRVDSNGVEGTIGEPNFPGTEPTCGVTIMQALIKPDRFEQVLQKGTELGACKFVPLATARVQPADANAASNSRFERWRRIAREARSSQAA